MSHAATIIGIPGLQIERVMRNRGIEVVRGLTSEFFIIGIQQRVIHKINVDPIDLYVTPGLV